MSVFGKSLVVSGLFLGSCLSSAAGPAGDVSTPPIDAEAPQVFETATFALG